MDIPQWHKDELDRRLKLIEDGLEEFQDFNEAMDEIVKELDKINDNKRHPSVPRRPYKK